MTKRLKLLDLFCGAGGAAMGYHRAGFEVVGVDIKTQKNYPFDFIQGDALNPPVNLRQFDLIHASPPCQAYTLARNNGCHKDAPALVEATRTMLIQSGKPFVIENVMGAPLQNALMLCGASFGLGVADMDLNRHRLFEVSHLFFVPECSHRRGQTIGVYGNGTNAWHREKLGRCMSVDEAREAMGISWMVRKELSQAIPPAYTEYIGKQMYAAIMN